MKSAVSQTLFLLDHARSGISESALHKIDPDLLTFGLEHSLVRLIPPSEQGQEATVILTGTALEQSLVLRDAGNPLFGIDIQPHGLVLRQELTEEQWLTTLRRLRLVKSAYHNVLADLITHGRSRFGNTFVDQSIEQLEFAFDDINHAESIAHVSLRLREAFPLTSEHYYILGLKFPVDHMSQELWADRARKHKLTPHLLKRSIEQDRILTEDSLRQLTGHQSGLPILQGMALPFNRWVSTVGGIDQVTQWEPERRAAVLQEIAPIVEFALAVRASLEPSTPDPL